MIYNIRYFNKVDNCYKTIIVEADNKIDAALIAHAKIYTVIKPFYLDEYEVNQCDIKEYNIENIVKKDDIIKNN